MSSSSGSTILAGCPPQASKLDEGFLVAISNTVPDGHLLGSQAVLVECEQQDTEDRSSLDEVLTGKLQYRYWADDTYTLHGKYNDVNETPGTRRLHVRLTTPFDSHDGTPKKLWASAANSNGELTSIGKYLMHNKEAREALQHTVHQAPMEKSSFTHELEPGVIHRWFDETKFDGDDSLCKDFRAPFTLTFTLEQPSTNGMGTIAENE